MRYLIDMAWRNVGRNRRRSLLAVLSVTISILLIVFMDGLIGGFLESMVKNYTRMETGHIRIASPDFEKRVRFLPIDQNLENADAIVQKINEIPELKGQIEVIAPRIQFGVLLNHNGNNKSALALAGEPEIEDDLLLLKRAILPGGQYLAAQKDLIMGAGLARALKYQVGDTVAVMTRGSDFALHLRKFKLVGVFQTGINAMDDKFFQIGLADARTLLRMGDGTQQLIVLLKDHQQADAFADKIRSALATDGIQVTPWTQIGDTYRLVTFASKFYGWLFFIIALLGAVIIANIMMMVVMERRKEIGILRSLGLGTGEVLTLFVLEGTFLGLTGSVVGATLGMLLNLYLSQHGMDFSEATKAGTVPMDNIIYSAINPLIWAKAILFGTVAAALISILPSRRATKLRIVETLKSV